MKKQILLTMFTLLSGAPLAASTNPLAAGGFMEAVNNGEFNAIRTWVKAIHSKNPTALSELTTLQSNSQVA